MPIPNVPIDSNRNSIVTMPPAKVSLAKTYDATISATTQITLNAATTMIEVTAIDKAIFMKWGTTAAVSTDWDHVIPANITRSFAVPVLTASTGALYTAVNFIEQAVTAILAVSEY